MIKHRKIFPFLISSFCLLLSSFCFLFHSAVYSAQMDMLDRVIATVNSQAIPESELNQQMQMLLVRLKQSSMNIPSEEVLKKQLLEKLILEKLQLQIAKEEKINIDDTFLDKAINDIASRDNMTLKQLKDYLENEKISFKRFRETIKNEIIISRLQQRAIGQQISISSSELDQFLNSPQGQDQSGAEYRVGHILIPLPENPDSKTIAKAEKQAKAVLNKLNSGTDFQEIALAQSSGQQALNGGDLGWRKSSELPTLFAKNVAGMSKGDVHGPIKNSAGFHIVKVLDKRLGDDNNIASNTIKNRAMDILYQRKFEELVGVWLKRLRDEAQIETYLNKTNAG